MSAHLSVFLSVCLLVCPYVRLSVRRCLSACLSLDISDILLACLPFRLFVCLSVCLLICLSVSIYLPAFFLPFLPVCSVYESVFPPDCLSDCPSHRPSGSSHILSPVRATAISFPSPRIEVFVMELRETFKVHTQWITAPLEILSWRGWSTPDVKGWCLL